MLLLTLVAGRRTSSIANVGEMEEYRPALMSESIFRPIADISGAPEGPSGDTAGERHDRMVLPPASPAVYDNANVLQRLRLAGAVILAPP